MRPTVVIACRVMQELLETRVPDDMPRVYLDILLHNHPKKLCAVLQEKINSVQQPSNIVVGYGLCGNGIVGVKARGHTLVIPRTHDCVAIFLGSHQRYIQRFFANPNTYYLTRGWIEAKDEPLTDYNDYVRDYGQEDADYIADMKYRHYKRLCMVGFSQQELDECRPELRKIAGFCESRWGMAYEEILGTTELLDAILQMTKTIDRDNREFVIVPEGGEISADMFLRPDEAPPAATARKG